MRQISKEGQQHQEEDRTAVLAKSNKTKGLKDAAIHAWKCSINVLWNCTIIRMCCCVKIQNGVILGDILTYFVINLCVAPNSCQPKIPVLQASNIIVTVKQEQDVCKVW